MSEPNEYREWILETIDSLRSRKARPDLERICRMVRRRHGSDPDRTRTELEKLIREQTVLKVNYKGSISYRNAAKVQRKSRKKSEFAAGGAEAARERTRRDPLSHNGDSAHSFTDPEEGEEDSEPSPDPLPQTPAGAADEPPPGPGGGNGRLDSRATMGCDVGSGCGDERASAQKERGSGRRGPEGCPAPALAHRTDGAASAADAGCGGAEAGRAAADPRVKTSSGGVGSPHQPHRQKHAAAPKSKVRVGGGGGKAAGGPANPDLGDRLVASVRSLSASRAVAPARGHVKPLGLKEILGYLSSQEQLSEEKLTRGKVKVVMEREVARGRLRRTRCGNITLPLWGLVVEDVRGAPRDAHTQRKDNEPMETASEEEEREENDEEEEDPRSSEEDGGRSPVAMTIEPELVEKTPGDVELLAESALQSCRQQPGVKALDLSGVSVHEPLTRTLHPPAQGASLSNSGSTPPSVEESAVIPDQLNMEAQTQMQLNSIPQNSSSVHSSESKTEVGVSSCLLTPTASPRDSGMSEERGMNGGVNSGGFMKTEVASGSPVDWTVSDVVNYFTAAGFPEQAAAFRTQEIDGKSLLLMQRNDVLTGLSIKLGPALKIYERHVKVLQKTHFEEDDC